jgi:hypothetical protein
MAAGRLRCLGSSQHLKSKYGKGYQVEIGMQQLHTAIGSSGKQGRQRSAEGISGNADRSEEETRVAAAVGELQSAIESVRSSDALLMSDQPSSLQQDGVGDDAGALGLSRAQLASVLRAVDKTSSVDSVEGSGMTSSGLLAERISEEGRGAVLHHSLISRGWVRLEEIAAWLVEERRMDTLHAFMRTNFGPRCVLHEQNGMRARYEVPQTVHATQALTLQQQQDQGGASSVVQAGTSPLSVAEIFGVLESNKAALNIREYSLSQTTLEQIFNRIASKFMV